MLSSFDRSTATRACLTTCNILELAGQADVRILILDADAPALLGLPLAET